MKEHLVEFRMAQPLYDPTAVQPMRDELIAVGIQELLTPEAVDEALGKPGTTMVVVNSVCGCAAGNARPGAMLALQNAKIPDQYTTVFAGQEREATNQARSHMASIQPSSPCIALFKDGQVVFCLERHHIEQMSAVQVAEALRQAFDEHCARQGPSIPEEELLKIPIFKACGSTIPLSRPE
jgi:putative YphP/YqiW family bacilliredoxin